MWLGSAGDAPGTAVPSPGGRLQTPDWLRIARSNVLGGLPRRSGLSRLNVVPSVRCAPYSLSRRSPAPSRHGARLLRGCFSQPPSSAAQGGRKKILGYEQWHEAGPRGSHRWPASRIVAVLEELGHLLERFLEVLRCVDVACISDETFEDLATSSVVGKTRVGGVDLHYEAVQQQMTRLFEHLGLAA